MSLLAPTAEHPSGRQLFSSLRLSDMTVSPGAHFTLPTFDLVLSPSRVTVQNYWCELAVPTKDSATTPTYYPDYTTAPSYDDVDNNNNNNRSLHAINSISYDIGNKTDYDVIATSNVFVETPILTLSILDDSTNASGNLYTVSCSVAFLSKAQRGQSYRVGFYADYSRPFGNFAVAPSGGGSEDGISQFISDPNAISYRSVLGHGRHFEYPVFQVSLERTHRYEERHSCRLLYKVSISNSTGGIGEGSYLLREVTSNYLYY